MKAAILIGYFVLLSLITSSHSSGLEYDYYRESCPQAQQIIKSTLRRIYDQDMSVAPALLRLVFHDCFVMVRSRQFIYFNQFIH